MLRIKSCARTNFTLHNEIIFSPPIDEMAKHTGRVTKIEQHRRLAYLNEYRQMVSLAGPLCSSPNKQRMWRTIQFSLLSHSLTDSLSPLSIVVSSLATVPLDLSILIQTFVFATVLSCFLMISIIIILFRKIQN